MMYQSVANEFQTIYYEKKKTGKSLKTNLILIRCTKIWIVSFTHAYNQNSLIKIN